VYYNRLCNVDFLTMLRKVGEQLTSGDLTCRQALADQRVAEPWRGRLDTMDAVCLPFRSARSAKWWREFCMSGPAVFDPFIA